MSGTPIRRWRTTGKPVRFLQWRGVGHVRHKSYAFRTACALDMWRTDTVGAPPRIRTLKDQLVTCLQCLNALESDGATRTEVR